MEFPKRSAMTCPRETRPPIIVGDVERKARGMVMSPVDYVGVEPKNKHGRIWVNYICKRIVVDGVREPNALSGPWCSQTNDFIVWDPVSLEVTRNHRYEWILTYYAIKPTLRFQGLCISERIGRLYPRQVGLVMRTV